ncbi:hypothetical protein HDU99_006225 [Rhizoclosmatium hyalinum]|nr:hypothetical protein HDU99_006225 [Rhizoclosmatium hyalinum]
MDTTDEEREAKAKKLQDIILILESLSEERQEELYGVMFKAKGILADVTLSGLNQMMNAISFDEDVDFDALSNQEKPDAPKVVETAPSNIVLNAAKSATIKSSSISVGGNLVADTIKSKGESSSVLFGPASSIGSKDDELDTRDPIDRLNEALLEIRTCMQNFGLAGDFYEHGGLDSVMTIMVEEGLPFLSPSAKALLNPVKPPTPPPKSPPKIRRPTYIPETPFIMPETPPTPPPPPPMKRKPSPPKPQPKPRPSPPPPPPPPPRIAIKKPNFHKSKLPPLHHKPPTKFVKVVVEREPWTAEPYKPIKPKTRKVLIPAPFSFENRVLQFQFGKPNTAPAYISHGKPQTPGDVYWAAVDPETIRLPRFVNADNGMDGIARAVASKDLKTFGNYYERMQAAAELMVQIHPVRDVVTAQSSIYEYEPSPRRNTWLDRSWGTVFDR